MASEITEIKIGIGPETALSKIYQAILQATQTAFPKAYVATFNLRRELYLTQTALLVAHWVRRSGL